MHINKIFGVDGLTDLGNHHLSDIQIFQLIETKFVGIGLSECNLGTIEYNVTVLACEEQLRLRWR